MHRFVRFLGVGGTTAALYFGLLGLTQEVLHLGYRIGLSLAYVIAISFHFLANRRFTFQAHRERMLGQAWRYIAVAAINYVVTIAIVATCVEMLGISVYAATAIAIAATVVIGYVASRAWVFQKKETVSSS
jgi:putative flippase GtrA